MEKFKSNMSDLITQNTILRVDFDQAQPVFEFNVIGEYDDLFFSEALIGSIMLRAPFEDRFTTSVVSQNRCKATVVTQFLLGDRITTAWMTKKPNALFENFGSLGVCRLHSEMKPYGMYTQACDEFSCEISLFATTLLDEEKVNCLAAHITWYKNYDGDISQKCSILSNLYSNMYQDVINSTNSVDEIMNHYYVAKFSNDPQLLLIQ